MSADDITHFPDDGHPQCASSSICGGIVGPDPDFTDEEGLRQRLVDELVRRAPMFLNEAERTVGILWPMIKEGHPE